MTIKVTQINTEVDATYTLPGDVWGGFCQKRGHIFMASSLEIESKGF